MKTNPDFQFTKEQTEALRDSLKKYFADEYELEIGDLQADFFIEFLNKQVGKEYYNRGVLDTIEALKEKSADLVLLIKD
jgi:uncharacterized protein (DUF2164 family)